MIEDYETPHQKDLARDLHDNLKQYMSYLNSCRPVSVSMESVSKYISPIVMSCQRNQTDVSYCIVSHIIEYTSGYNY